MDSLVSGTTSMRDRHMPSSSSVSNDDRDNISSNVRGQRKRLRFPRLAFLRKISLLQLFCGFTIFFFAIFICQLLLLPGSTTENEKKSARTRHFFRKKNGELNSEDFSFLKELDFGEDMKSFKILGNFRKDSNEANEVVGSRNVTRFGHRKPRLALVFADLWDDPYQILMVTIATALEEIGYEIEVFSLELGPVHVIWRELGIPLSVITADKDMKFSVDWLNFNGILVNSLKAAGVLSSLMQEPFKSIPLVWTIHENTLPAQLKKHVSSGQNGLIDKWIKVFSRATAIVFPNYILPMAYSVCDTGNYLVIPGSPDEAWKSDKLMAPLKDNPRLRINYGPEDFVVAIVGSQISYRGLWLEHALVLQALHPLLTDFSNSSSCLKIIILAGNSISNYHNVVETIALNLRYPKETVKCVAVDEDTDNVLSTADIVIYGSFLEEHTFPDILLKAMCLGKPIIAPDLPMIWKYVRDEVNGYIFRREDIKSLTEIMLQMISNGKLSVLARNAASIGKYTARNLMVSESVEGYTSLLESILMLPSEVAVSLAAKDIPEELKTDWQWHLFEAIEDTNSPNKTWRNVLDEVEKQLNHIHKENTMALITENDTVLYTIWKEQKYIDIANMRERIEDEELEDRTEQPQGTWDKVYRSVRRFDYSLHERDEGELERTGQPLCIYEPYLGEGTWPFLHRTSLYRGLGLSTKGRRPGADDVDAPSRLPLLNNTYYRDVLGEFGAFFAIANRSDRLHKNAWIGFQSWRATARTESLTKIAERSLLDAIEAQTHGDTLYFWAHLNMDRRSPFMEDFWSFCDTINAGNCQFAFSEALKTMYSIKHNLSSLLPMPMDEGTWSVMHCWALPTKSFMEFVMFSRMFVDALDAQFYDDHQKTGRCYLSLTKDNHCYSRLLELLVNVWAYHSARRMVYVDAETGYMQEQHPLESRKGRMWVKWFQFSTLKNMDEDLAEEFDSDNPERRWLWPLTGEVFWKGIHEKQKKLRQIEKEKKKQRTKERIRRMKKRIHQEVLGKYVKPSEDEPNSTTLAARLFR